MLRLIFPVVVRPTLRYPANSTVPLIVTDTGPPIGAGARRGYRIACRRIGDPTRRVNGSIPTSGDGTGLLTRSGVGSPITMDAGFSIARSAGSGCRETNGGQRGCVGVGAERTSVGV